MFKKTNPNPQLNMFTAPSVQLGSYASKKYSDPNTWHNQFYSLVTTKIDEEIFSATESSTEFFEISAKSPLIVSYDSLRLT